MTPVPATPTTNLLRMPLELREAIYELTVGADDDAHEVDVYSKCTPRSTLSLVCKQTHKELEAVIKRKAKWPCKHTKFSFHLWDPRESIDVVKHRLGFGSEQGMRCQLEHDLENTTRLRVVCINSGQDNPTAVTATFHDQARTPAFSIYGVSASRCGHLHQRFARMLDRWQASAQKDEKALLAQETVIGIRIAVHRVFD